MLSLFPGMAAIDKKQDFREKFKHELQKNGYLDGMPLGYGNGGVSDDWQYKGPVFKVLPRAPKLSPEAATVLKAWVEGQEVFIGSMDFRIAKMDTKEKGKYLKKVGLEGNEYVLTTM